MVCFPLFFHLPLYEKVSWLEELADESGHRHKFISMQNYHNLLYREEEREMLPYCRASGVGCIPWSPVARGVLARPWGDRSTKREKTDQILKSLLRTKGTETDKTIVDRLEEVAKKRGLVWRLWLLPGVSSRRGQSDCGVGE